MVSAPILLIVIEVILNIDEPSNLSYQMERILFYSKFSADTIFMKNTSSKLDIEEYLNTLTFTFKCQNNKVSRNVPRLPLNAYTP